MRIGGIGPVVILAVLGAACVAGPDLVPVSPAPGDPIRDRLTHQPGTLTGIEAVDRIIAVVINGDPLELSAKMTFLTAACTEQDGLGGPPKCEEGEEEGSSVDVFPFLGPEGHFLRKTEVADWQGLDVSGLYSVYRVSESAFSDPFYPTGEYAIVFLADDDFMDITLQVTEGRIVRIDYGFGESPEINFETSASEIILPPPE